MNLGRGMPIPLENKVVKSGEIWVPPTPEKPVVRRSSHVTAEMQQNLMGAKNWGDLLGIYTGLLQDENSNRLPPGFNPCSHVGVNRGEPSQNVAPIETCNGLPPNLNATCFIDLNQECNMQDLTFVETCNRISQDLNPTSFVGQNQWELEHSPRDVAPVENLRILNQYGGTVGTYVQNLDVLPPQKVDSLAELMGTNKHPHTTLTNGPSNRPASIIGNSTIINQHSLVRSNGKMRGPSSSILLQNRILNEKWHFGGHKTHNLQQISTNTFPVPYHADRNLNLPQRLKGASSSGTIPFQFEPVTPDLQKQMKNNKPMQVPKFFANDCLTPEKHKKDDAVCSQPSEIIERKYDELGSNPDTSSKVISTPPNEKIHFDGGNGEIDLNKTPQQRPSKRKKHRPKVIVEGKPKRTPKSDASRKRAADKNPSEKRKYVSKKGTRTSTTPLTDVAKDVEGYNVGSAAKSCRRVLNFNLENGVEKDSQATEVGNQTQNEERSKVPINLNFDSPNTEWVTELNKAVKSTHVIENLYNRVQSVNHIPPPELLTLPSTPSPPASKGHTLNVIARSLNARNANANQNGGPNRHSHLHQLTSEDLVQLVIEANSNEPNLDKMCQPNLHAMTQLLEDLVSAKENQGCKRDYSHTVLRQPQTVTLMGSQLWSSNMSHASSDSSKICLNVSETMKKRRIEGIIHGTTSSMSSRITTVEDCTGQMDTKCKSLHAQSSAIYLNDGLPNSDIKEQCTSRYQNYEFNKVHCDWYMKSKDFKGKFQQRHTSPHFHAKEKAQKTSDHLTQAQSTNSFATVTNWNLESASERDPITRGNVVNYHARVSIKRQISGQTSDKLSSINKVSPQLITHSRGRGRPPKTLARSQESLRTSSSVDYIIDHMKGLNINTSGKEISQEERSALVPYRGDGAIVSYEAFDMIKKRRPRPKVDLDPETNRLWNLLMGKEGSESAETLGDDKQQWWEKERKVLCNRADSFIARMHLVQGDRRFSKWKGSVVDSVIGVFLTQNVSDHLSSSAFMHLAAKFPIKPTAIRELCCQNGQSSLIERHKVRITYPDGTSYDHRMIREPVYNPSSVTSSESSECGAEFFTTRRTYILNDQTRKIEEDMISSQSSSESVIIQASEDIRSSSGSNSEAEDQIPRGNFSRNHGPSSFYEQAERIAAFKQCQLQVNGSSFPSTRPVPGHQQLENPMHGQFPQQTSRENACTHPFASNVLRYQRPVTPLTSSWPNMTKGLEKLEGDIIIISGKGSISSMASTDANLTNGTGVENRHYFSGQNVEKNFIAQQTGKPKLQPSTADKCILNEHFEQQTYLSACSRSRKDQHVANYRKDGTQEAFQQEHKFLTDPTRPAEVSSKPPIDNQKHSENITPEPSEMSQVHSSNGPPTSKIGTKISRVSKQKAEKEKTDSFNWDALRKKVQSETGMRARNADTMDSIDYEAIRNADVGEISETIKERGMNNMLAERIKAFLDRLVQEHERIDLEWLRDVQPDKVKDYLLSVRGLGLKSVECVRLLTLHNVAFPVDTNVGRIAVRLGWVPLRPLPESLQLHLLELYPVLESIQKYLWPRLCHLDQETLYELHYQMITFGKVFCTKRDPNCNACPMRGDCRHFASAYASARLALPGTEGKQVVCSSTPTSANQMSGMTMKPMPLLPLKENLEKGVDSMRNSEPIIEEPKTPEPPTELTERDIEDAYYEDPDEIPVIKLNIEEFTSNLQSFMQEQKEMQGDMSKALVALSPEFASIPTPKLKNVSRLRTEHQVYELPDLHPIVKGLDKREPDDPSPYLLAIWTPGETSDSVKPPESKCDSQEGGSMCDKKTCFSCSNTREAQTQTVRGTILIPCRTAMRGSFPLNGTYFQVNEVFADHESSMNPIVVPRSLLWNLSRRTVFFGTSVTTIFKGLTTEGIQYCFWKGFVCVRGFDQKTRAPRPLSSRLHYPASKMVKPNEKR